MPVTYLSNEQSAHHLVNQWHPAKNGTKTPQNTASGSGIEAWWVCPISELHVWQASPAARVSQRQGCPYCAGRKVLAGYNDLPTTNPKLASEWNHNLNTLPIQEVSASSNKKAWWICPVGEDHVWEATINSRNQGNKCPFCSNRKVLPGFNDLASSEYALVISQWHPTKNKPLEPTIISPSSNKKVWWMCSAEHEWEAIVANRTKKGSGCPKCPKNTGSIKMKPVSSDAILARDWHEDNVKSPKDVTLGSSYKALWQCHVSEDHVWEASIANRVRGSGCPVCSGQKIITGVNDLASDARFKAIAEQWHSDNTLNPTEISAGTTVKAKWNCENGHLWESSIYSRIYMGQGCPECLGRTKQGEKRLRVSDYPELVSQWHPENTVEISTLTFRSRKPVKWLCPKDSQHVWTASPSSRSLDGSDCPVCSSRLILNGVNDLASHEKFAPIARQWHPDNILTPEEVSYSSKSIAKWQCEIYNNHVWDAVIYSRTRDNASGCPFCATINKSSKAEQEIFDILTLLGINAQRNIRGVIPGELDIYIPSLNYAIEFNGLYWHSEAIRPDKNYHANKLQACKAKGITLYTVWEDDWNARKDIIIRGLAHRLGVSRHLDKVLPEIPQYWYGKVGARKTTSVTLTFEESKNFLNKHHIQGSANSNHYFGLKDSQERLRAVLLLSKSSGTEEFRIDRYATAGTVSGGFTKLLSHAESLLNVSRWVTFADLQISDGGLYDGNGFIVDKVLPPDYSYFVKGKRVHKFNYRLKRFKTDDELLWEDGLSERELAKLNGIHRIWDSGKYRYVKNI